MIRAVVCIGLLLSLQGCAGAVIGLSIAASTATIAKDAYEGRLDYLTQHETAVIHVDHACPTRTPC